MSERISALRTGKGNPEAEGTTTAFEHPLPEGEEDEDYIDTGNAILNFYCTLVDLLGRCAPDARVLSHVTAFSLFFLFTSKRFILFILPFLISTLSGVIYLSGVVNVI